MGKQTKVKVTCALSVALIINKSGSANGRSQERRAKLCLRTNTYTHSFSQLIVFWRFIALCEYKWHGHRAPLFCRWNSRSARAHPTRWLPCLGTIFYNASVARAKIKRFDMMAAALAGEIARERGRLLTYLLQRVYK